MGRAYACGHDVSAADLFARLYLHISIGASVASHWFEEHPYLLYGGWTGSGELEDDTIREIVLHLLRDNLNLIALG